MRTVKYENRRFHPSVAGNQAAPDLPYKCSGGIASQLYIVSAVYRHTAYRTSAKVFLFFISTPNPQLLAEVRPGRRRRKSACYLPTLPTTFVQNRRKWKSRSLSIYLFVYSLPSSLPSPTLTYSTTSRNDDLSFVSALLSLTSAKGSCAGLSHSPTHSLTHIYIYIAHIYIDFATQLALFFSFSLVCMYATRRRLDCCCGVGS